MARKAGEDKRQAEDFDSETLEITEDDAGWVLGKGGLTKMKLARVSKCEIEFLDQELMLEFTGTSKQRRRAMRYVKCVIAQRTGPVVVSEEDVADDCTVQKIPQEAVGFVTGRGGNFLRTLEDDHGTIMCFAEREGVELRADEMELLIFGDRVARRGAQLAVMGVVETKVPGYFTDRWHAKGTTFENKSDMTGDWGTATMQLTQDELSYAIGSQGKTRKKLGRSSGCIVQYIGGVVFMSGTKRQRERAKEYLKFLLEQLEGPLFVDLRDRDDATSLEVPLDCVGYVTGRSRETLSMVEEQFGTLMFFMTKNKDKEKESETLAIFGPFRARRGAELMIMSAVERKLPGYYTEKLRDKKTNTKGFDTDRLSMDSEDMAYALGKEGTTRQKLATASNAILQFVGGMAFIAGEHQERQRCRDYLGWLLEQKDSKITVDGSNRSDITEVDIDEDGVGRLLSSSGIPELRRIEQESGTFCCLSSPVEGESRLLICGHEEGSPYSETGRLKAERMIKRLLSNLHRDNGWDGGGGYGGRWQRDRSRSPRRWGGGKKGGKGGGKDFGKGGKGSWSHQQYEAPQWPATRSQKGGSWSSSYQEQGRWRDSSWGDSRSASAAPPRPPRPPAGGGGGPPGKRGRSPTPPWRSSKSAGGGGGYRGGGGSWDGGRSSRW